MFFKRLGVLSLWERWKVFVTNSRKETCPIAPKYAQVNYAIYSNDNYNYLCLKTQRPKMFFDLTPCGLSISRTFFFVFSSMG